MEEGLFDWLCKPEIIITADRVDWENIRQTLEPIDLEPAKLQFKDWGRKSNGKSEKNVTSQGDVPAHILEMVKAALGISPTSWWLEEGSK